MRLRGAAALAVLTAVAGGLGVVALGDWRTGAVAVAVAVLTGGALRLALPARAAGWLVVRSRGLDAALLLGAGGAMLALALTIPD